MAGSSAAVLWCSICVICLPQFVISQSAFLYDYGNITTDDIASPAADDDCSVGYNESIVFFGTTYNSISICTNGMLSLDSEYSAYTPNAFPLTSGKAVIAPFWADSDLRIGGNIWSRVENDTTLLSNASDYVTSVYDTSFLATWALVVTWDEILAYGSLDYGAVNLHQAVILSNTTDTYAIFLYDLISWTHGSATSVHAQVGFDAGDGTNYYAVSTSQTADVADIASETNVGRTGMWIFKLSDATVSEPDMDTTVAAQGTTTQNSVTTTVESAPSASGSSTSTSTAASTTASDSTSTADTSTTEMSTTTAGIDRTTTAMDSATTTAEVDRTTTAMDSATTTAEVGVSTVNGETTTTPSVEMTITTSENRTTTGKQETTQPHQSTEQSTAASLQNTRTAAGLSTVTVLSGGSGTGTSPPESPPTQRETSSDQMSSLPTTVNSLLSTTSDSVISSTVTSQTDTTLGGNGLTDAQRGGGHGKTSGPVIAASVVVSLLAAMGLTALCIILAIRKRKRKEKKEEEDNEAQSEAQSESSSDPLSDPPVHHEYCSADGGATGVPAALSIAVLPQQLPSLPVNDNGEVGNVPSQLQPPAHALPPLRSAPKPDHQKDTKNAPKPESRKNSEVVGYDDINHGQSNLLSTADI